VCKVSTKQKQTSKLKLLKLKLVKSIGHKENERNSVKLFIILGRQIDFVQLTESLLRTWQHCQFLPYVVQIHKVELSKVVPVPSL
jgi:hypothetical protein